MTALTCYLACSFVMYGIGIYCLIVKRNMIRLLIALEIMMNAVNLSLVAFSSAGTPGFVHPMAHAFTILSIGIGGCVIALGLAITLQAYMHYRTLDASKLRRLRW